MGIIQKILGAVLFMATVMMSTTAFATDTDKLAAKIDVKPGDEMNAVNSDTDTMLEVALLGSEDFDVNNVDVNTVTLGEVKSSKDSLVADSNGDGIADLIFVFSTAELGLENGDSELTLKGQTKDGKSFEGTDKVSNSKTEA